MEVIYEKGVVEKVKDVIEESYYKGKKIEKFIFTSDEVKDLLNPDAHFEFIIDRNKKGGFISSFRFEVKD